MSPANRKRLVALFALLVSGGVLAFISLSDIGDNLVYYWDAQQLLDQGERGHGVTVRLGGVVKNKSVQWVPETLALSFDVGIAPEAGGPTVRVAAKGTPPQMFREGIGVVVEGKYDGATFNADRVLVKHSNEYRPPGPGEKPEDIYKTLISAEATAR
jgi:cytochrome c-type biogenesis protein CcmE